MTDQTFVTTVNCMDGRVQKPVFDYLSQKYGGAFVDTITEPTPSKILSNQTDTDSINSILKRIEVSITKHHSQAIAIAAHHDCAGNPVPKSEQLAQLKKATSLLKEKYSLPIRSLWVNENWQVEEINSAD